MNIEKLTDRRLFLGSALAGATALSVLRQNVFAQPADKDEDVTPLEDLMREHGVLNRVLLVYEECQRRIRRKADLNPKLLNQAALIIRDFIESYHEKTEETYVFPRLENAGKLTALCHTLKIQHEAGRGVTSKIISLSNGSPKGDDLVKIDAAISAFIRMYRPHESFEDTVIFPEFKKLIPKKEYEELGEKFEEEEHKRLGKEGIEGVLEHVTDLEKALGIHDINQFTPG